MKKLADIRRNSFQIDTLIDHLEEEYNALREKDKTVEFVDLQIVNAFDPATKSIFFFGVLLYYYGSVETAAKVKPKEMYIGMTLEPEASVA